MISVFLPYLVGALLFSVVLVFFLFRRRNGKDTSTVLFQQLESLRSDMRQSLQFLTDNVNRQLSSVSQQIQSQTTNVGRQLDNAAQVIGGIQKNLGELGEATRDIKDLGQSVTKLGDLFRAPKFRGGLGEFLLEDLLKQVLPAESFAMQYRFQNGQTVDAVIRTSGRLTPVDSKFPLENFQKMLSSSSENEKKPYRRLFISDVKRHIDAVAAKYILPDEGTFSFALMYIPAENIYYEIIIKEDGVEGGDLYSYALDRKVVPVSPSSFYAYLQVVALGLRGMVIEQNARGILDGLTRLHGDVSRLRETFDTMGSHLENAYKKYDEVNKKLSRVEGKIETAVMDSHTDPLPSTVTLLSSNSDISQTQNNEQIFRRAL